MFGNVWIMSCAAGDGSLLSCFRSPDLTVNVNTALVFPKRRKSREQKTFPGAKLFTGSLEWARHGD